MPWKSLAEIKAATAARKRANPEVGDYFGPDETRFFGSKPEPAIYGGRYFVESVQPPYGDRIWHVKRVSDELDFDSIGRWGSAGYSQSEAHELAAKVGFAEETGTLTKREGDYYPCDYCEKDRPGWAAFVQAAGESGNAYVCSECVPKALEREFEAAS